MALRSACLISHVAAALCIALATSCGSAATGASKDGGPGVDARPRQDGRPQAAADARVRRDGNAPTADAGVDSGSPPACRLAYDVDAGISATHIDQIAIYSDCAACADAFEPPPVVVETPSLRRLVVARNWTVAELVINAEGRLTGAVGNSGILEAVQGSSPSCGAWTLGGDHGAGQCQDVDATLTASALGGYVYSWNQHDMLGFLLSVGGSGLGPVTSTIDCPSWGPLYYPVGSNVALYSASAVSTGAVVPLGSGGFTCPLDGGAHTPNRLHDLSCWRAGGVLLGEQR